MTDKYRALAILITLITVPLHAMPVGNFENITPERGFGSGLNKYSWASTTFSVDNSIYIGTFNVNLDYLAAPTYLNQIQNAANPDLAALDAFRRLWSGSPVTPSTGGEIWRYDGNWTQVYKADAEDVGFRKMIEYDGHIYAGTADGPNGPGPGDAAYTSPPLSPPPTTVDYTGAGTALLRSADGNSWEEVAGGPSLNERNASNRTMAVIDNKLWVGTENPIDGPEVWSYDGANWKLEKKLAFGPIPQGLAVGQIAEYNGDVYIGTWASGDGFQLLKLGPDNPNGQRTSTDVTPQFSDPTVLEGDQGVMQLRVFNGQLFLGTVNYTGGFSFMSTSDPENAGVDGWNLITKDGFGSEYPGMGGTAANAYTWSSEVINGIYYLGTFNTNTPDSWIDQLIGQDVPLDGRGQIWYSEDGVTWHQLEGNGFDSLFTYGFRTMTNWNNRLVVGSASNFFLPDIFSIPYSELSPEQLAQLADLIVGFGVDPDNALDILASGAASLLGSDSGFDWGPYIGTEVFVSDVAIPLPGAFWMFFSALVGLWGARRSQISR